MGGAHGQKSPPIHPSNHPPTPPSCRTSRCYQDASGPAAPLLPHTVPLGRA
ncbi:hypothetical protein E2C01_099844 [Portunus trituberculatus]|uniref:Uncharacterized protein n=1 Tax=Portunus trituberculatus TaxID=210409 RepID=A0A5B7KAK7_PORTR|nr:hypothetical protein [Portunus trituberculatus]